MSSEIRNLRKHLLYLGGLQPVHAAAKSAIETCRESRRSCCAHRALYTSLRRVAEDARSTSAGNGNIKQPRRLQYQAWIWLAPRTWEDVLLQSRHEYYARGKSLCTV